MKQSSQHVETVGKQLTVDEEQFEQLQNQGLTGPSSELPIHSLGPHNHAEACRGYSALDKSCVFPADEGLSGPITFSCMRL